MYRIDPTTKNYLDKVSVVLRLENLGPDPFFFFFFQESGKAVIFLMLSFLLQ